MSIEREIAHDLLSIGAVFLRPDEPFTWTEGLALYSYVFSRFYRTPARRPAVNF